MFRTELLFIIIDHNEMLNMKWYAFLMYLNAYNHITQMANLQRKSNIFLNLNYRVEIVKAYKTFKYFVFFSVKYQTI